MTAQGGKVTLPGSCATNVEQRATLFLPFHEIAIDLSGPGRNRAWPSIVSSAQS